jgi:hypothetical protein
MCRSEVLPMYEKLAQSRESGSQDDSPFIKSGESSGMQDSWDSSRHDQHVEKHDEHSLPQPIPFTCFECGQCLMPHLHWHNCPKLGSPGCAAAAHAVA